MENVCDGSRRPVRGKRHKLTTTASGHTEAECPVCKQRVPAREIFGAVEFTRHELDTPDSTNKKAKKK